MDEESTKQTSKMLNQGEKKKEEKVSTGEVELSKVEEETRRDA